MTAKKLPSDLAKTRIYGMSISGFLLRVIIYSTLFFRVIGEPIFFDLSHFLQDISNTYLEPEQRIADSNRLQQAYFAENNTFIHSIKLFKEMWEKIDIYHHRFPDRPASLTDKWEATDKYNYRILSSMGPVQTLPNNGETAKFESAITIAEPNDMNRGKSYTGAVFAFKEKGSNVIKTISAICESDRENPTYSVIWSQPTFDGREIHCQPGTTMLILR